MKTNWVQWLQIQDQKIRSAQGQSVKSELRKLNLKKVPRGYVSEVANLARRLNMSHLMLRLLHPLVFPTTEFSRKANDLEKSMYALALSRLGAHKESAEFLKSTQKSTKEILFIQASAWISQWNYIKAEKIYRRLLNFKNLTENEIWIAKINLASCFVDLTRYPEAIDLLKDFDQLKETYTLLYGNSRELLAQAHLQMKNFDLAELNIRESLASLGEQDYSLFARKWLLIIRSMKDKNLSQNDWKSLRHEALLNHDYDTLRDVDFYIALLTKDSNLLQHVYFGTHLESYRKKILNNSNTLISSQVSYKIPYPQHSRLNSHLDLQSGLYTYRDKVTALSGLKLILLRCLSRDFYRPLPVAELFSYLYPGENFNIHTSPHRLFQLVQTTRQFLKDHQISLNLEFQRGCYSLRCINTSVQTYQNYKKILPVADSFVLEKLQKWIDSRPETFFTRTHLQTEFQISKTTAVRWLQLGAQHRLFRRNGQGNRAYYHTRKTSLKAAS